MNFQTHYNRTPSPPEVNNGEKLVEVAGYISAQQRIENIIAAGHRLDTYRKEQYDFQLDGIDEDFEDPTRSKNFDLSDGTFYGSILEHKKAIAEEEAVKTRIAAEVTEDKLKASQTAPEGSGGVSETPAR